MRRLRWPLAVVLAAGLHALLLVSIEAPRTETGARAPGEQGLVIDVAPAGAAPGAEQPTAQPQQKDRQKPEPEPEAEPDAEPDPRIAERAPDPAREPEREPEPDPEPRPAEPAPEAKPRQEPEPKTASETREGRAGANRGEAAATTDGRAGGGDPGARADYLDRLRVHLERHKEYPRRARLRRLEGTVRVSFTVHADGRITGARVTEGSGKSTLDAAARRMLERADPAPSFPEKMASERIELTVPVRYSLR